MGDIPKPGPLPDGERAKGWAQFMRTWPIGDEVATLKDEGRLAWDATDQWWIDNAASFDKALPDAARNAWTPEQKHRLFLAILTYRFAKSKGA